MNLHTLHVYGLGGDYHVTPRFLTSRGECFQDARQAIQWALDNAAPYMGSVVIEPGEYPLDEPLRVPSGVRLSGCGRGTKLVVDHSNEAGIAVQLDRAHGSRLNDFSVHPVEPGSGRMGVLASGCGEVTVENIGVYGFGEVGITLCDNCFLCSVTSCVAADNRVANFRFRQLSRGEYGDFIPSSLRGCTSYGGGTGFDLDNAVVTNVTGCTVYQSGGVGFHLHNVSNSVLISGCRTFQVGKQAVLVEDSHELNLQGNIFCWHQKEGILIRKCRWGTISGNQVIDSGSLNLNAKDLSIKFNDLPESPPSYHGIHLEDTAGLTVSNNAIFNWHVCPVGDAGIYEDARSSGNTVVGNNINYFKEGVRSDGSKNTTIADNVFDPKCHIWRHRERPAEGIGIQSYEPHLPQRFIDELVFKSNRS